MLFLFFTVQIDVFMCVTANNDTYEYSERERELLKKCIRLIQGRHRDSSNNIKDNDVASPSDEITEMTTSMMSSIMSNGSVELCSPERAALPGECAPFPPIPASPPGPRDPELVLYVPDMEEIRISPVVARKGYLNVLEHKTHGWKKRWVVSIYDLNLKYLTGVNTSTKYGKNKRTIKHRVDKIIF